MPREGDFIGKGHDRTPGGDGHTLCLGFGRGYTSVYTGQNSLNQTLKICAFYCMLNISVVQIN